MKNYKKRKDKALKAFDELLDEARSIVRGLEVKEKIELQANGVTFIMIDPFGDDGELSDVISVENGEIELENGSVLSVNDITNLTDLIGLIDVIDE